MTNRRKNKISGWLLVVFISYLCSVSLFVHIHNTEDGRTIVHSHPYSGNTSNPGHGHSTVEFQAIAHLASLVMIMLWAIRPGALDRITKILYRPAALLPEQETGKYPRPMRGPPAALISA